MSKSVRKLLLSILLLAAAVVASTWPLVTRLGTGVPFNLGDPLFEVWLLRRNWLAMLHDPAAIFDTNIFHPVMNTLTMADNMLVPSIIFGLVYALLDSAVASYNLLLLVALVLSGLAMTALVQHWTGNSAASLAAGLAYSLSPIVLAQIGTGKLLMTWWLPLAVLAADRLAQQHRARYAVLAAIFLWLQFLSSVYLAFFAATAVTITFTMRLYSQDGWAGLRQRRLLIACAIGGVIGASLLGPLAWQYRQMSRDWEVVRTVKEAVFYSASPSSFLAAESGSRLSGLLGRFRAKQGSYEKYRWPGLVIVALAGLGVYRHRVAPGQERRHTRVAVLAGSGMVVVGAVMALGPHLIINGNDTGLPLPYLAAYHLVPGFDSMRVPARFAFLMVAGLAILAGCGVDACSRRWSDGRRRALAPWTALALLLLSLTLTRRPLLIADTTELDGSELTTMLASRQPGALIWLPLLRENGTPDIWRNARRMYINQGLTPMVNGYSGFHPPPFFDIAQLVQVASPDVAVSVLQQLNIRTVILDLDQPELLSLEGWEKLIAAGLATLAGRSENHLVMALPAVQPPAAPPQWQLPSFAVPADFSTTVGLRIRNEADVPWVNSGPYRRTPVQVTWRDRAGTVQHRERTSLLVPMYVLPASERSVPLQVRVPRMPGAYDVTVHGQDIEAAGRVTVVLGSASTSQSDKRGLVAHLDLAHPEPQLVVRPGGTVRVSVSATNKGRAVWLGGLPQPVGEVRLGYEWHHLATEKPLPELTGRVRLMHDVHPGSSAPIRAAMRAPSKPGRYTLTLAMVSEGVAWFHLVNPSTSPPLRLQITVMS